LGSRREETGKRGAGGRLHADIVHPWHIKKHRPERKILTLKNVAPDEYVFSGEDFDSSLALYASMF
jgi:hypothetical protein